MRYIRGILYRLLFLGLSAPIAVGIAIAGLISKNGVRAGARLWAGWFLWCSRHLLGIRLVVRGEVPQTGVIVAFKHQSAYETILTLQLFDAPAVVMKAELRKIPVWGRLAHLHGSIFVERGQGGGALKSMLRQGRLRKQEGRPIVIFPEGTRVDPGTQPPLKGGLFGLYSVLDMPIVPVALDAGLVWPKGWVKGPGVVTMAFGKPIPTGLSREEMDAAVHAAINADPLTVAVA